MQITKKAEVFDQETIKPGMLISVIKVKTEGKPLNFNDAQKIESKIYNGIILDVKPDQIHFAAYRKPPINNPEAKHAVTDEYVTIDEVTAKHVVIQIKQDLLLAQDIAFSVQSETPKEPERKKQPAKKLHKCRFPNCDCTASAECFPSECDEKTYDRWKARKEVKPGDQIRTDVVRFVTSKTEMLGPEEVTVEEAKNLIATEYSIMLLRNGQKLYQFGGE